MNDVTWPTASGPGVEKMTMMSKGFGALMTDVKARIGALFGPMRSENVDAAAARAVGTKNDPPRHPRSSFRDSVGQPMEHERTGATSRLKRIQDPGD